MDDARRAIAIATAKRRVWKRASWRIASSLSYFEICSTVTSFDISFDINVKNSVRWHEQKDNKELKPGCSCTRTPGFLV